MKMKLRNRDVIAETDPHQQMERLLFGPWITQAIGAIADLSIADHLAADGLTAAEIAAREGSAPDTTFRVMRAGVTCGLLTADRKGRFFSTPLLDTLRQDAPRSLRSVALWFTDKGHWLGWQGFVDAVRTGHTQVAEVLGVEWFDYLQQNPDQARRSAEAMAALTSLWSGDIARAIDTSDVRLAVDVGGSTGALLRMLQRENPTLEGIVFDRPNIVTDVAVQIAKTEFGCRTEVIGGDFFQSVPVGDLYLLKHILHNWDDESCIRILSRCREAMRPGGRIMIIELVVGDFKDPGVAALMDLRMLTAHGGRERSLTEYDVLLEAAGLRRRAIAQSDTPVGLVEAVRV
jgi:hypothetical protein